MSAPRRELDVGTSFGPYRVLARLGRGAMGAVYRVRDASGTELALKVMLGEDAQEPRFVARFHREAQAAAAVLHPGVARCVASGELEGRPFMALELVTGGTLSDRLHRAGRLAWRDAVAVALEIASALEAVHAAGLVHRDLKPANVLLDRAGRAKLTDFGIARAVAEQNALTKTGEVLGSAEYMAPEQAGTAASADGRADLYALGATLHTLIAGAPPFSGALLSVFREKLTEAPPSLRAIDPGVPSALEDLVRSLLAPDPAGRPPTARATIEALEAILREAPPTATRAPGGLLLGLGLAATTAVVATLGLVAFRLRGEAPPAPAPLPPPPRATPAPSPTPGGEPPWFRGLPEGERPPLPLPPSVRFGTRPREYLLARDPTVLLVFVPGGDFLMGEDDPESPDNRPAHRVRLSPYFLGQTEVTTEQFELFATSSAGKGLVFPPGRHRDDDTLDPTLDWRCPIPGVTVGQPRAPVVRILPEHALAYAAWAGAALPTEAQWERAATWGANGRKLRFPWGDQIPDFEHPRLANLNDASLNKAEGRNPVYAGYVDDVTYLAPVRSFPQDLSPVGAYDMMGNVREICRDVYDRGAFYEKCLKEGVVVDPVNERPLRPEDKHVVRGGSWGATDPKLSGAARYPLRCPDDLTGFRVVVPCR